MEAATLTGKKTIAFGIAHEILTKGVNIPTIFANGRKLLDTVRKPEGQIDIPSFVKLVESEGRDHPYWSCGYRKYSLPVFFYRKARELKQPLQKIEKDVFGTTSALVASRVLHTWNIPPMVCEGVAFHQMPELAPPEYSIIAGLTQFAFGIAADSGIGCSGDGIKMDLSSAFLGQKPNLKLLKKTVQESLIKEITASMKDQTNSITSPGEGSQPAAHKMKNFVNQSLENTSDPVKKSKKGIFAWAKGILI